EIVRHKRAELKISQEELAFKCRFDRTYISLVERGLRNISFTNLLILAEGLNTTISPL
ncbi:MAG: XRE family transcriptional regulator, partial [Flavobacteriales bacterium CG_4_9_14_3_um_filter_32_8]